MLGCQAAGFSFAVAAVASGLWCLVIDLPFCVAVLADDGAILRSQGALRITRGVLRRTIGVLRPSVSHLRHTTKAEKVDDVASLDV